MKNPLHRKKLQLAIKTVSNKQGEKSAELDFIWVTRRFPRAHAGISRFPAGPTLTLFFLAIQKGGWTTSACRNTKTSSTRAEWTDRCCSTSPW